MAKTLNEQANLPGNAVSLVTSGAPMSAYWARDMGKWINNLGTYVEPSFQFLLDSGLGGTSGSSVPQTGKTWRSGDPGAGTLLLAQAPVLLPTQAVRICTTAGLLRGRIGEITVNVDITELYLFLSNAPYRHDRPAASFTPLGTGAGDFPTFTEAYLQPGYTKRTIVGAQIANRNTGSGNPVYAFADDTDPGWENWLPSVVEQHQESIAWLIVAAGFENANVDSTLFLREFSFWGQYE